MASRWPMFEAGASTGRLLPSSASAGNGPSSSRHPERRAEPTGHLGGVAPPPVRAGPAEGIQQVGAGQGRFVGVALHLGERDGPAATVPSANRTESPESFQPWLVRPRPELVVVVEKAVAVRVPVVGHPGQSAFQRRGSAPAPDRRPSPIARRRPAGTPTAGWHRPCRSTPAAGTTAPGRVDGRRTSCRILPGCSSVVGSTATPCIAASVRRVPAASSVPSGSVIRAAHSESRPKSVRYQGDPAARNSSSGCAT